jgi:putative hydrolase of the HAD superfamily
VRDFETGRIEAHEFASQLIEEFEIQVSEQEFIDAFAGWPTSLFPGALELVAQIPRRYVRAVLSNSNALHWPRVRDDMELGGAFDHYFISHLTGRIKPDAAAFEHVVESLRCRPGEVLFLDDNLINVEAARAVGMDAFVVRGAAEAERVLRQSRVIA